MPFRSHYQKRVRYRLGYKRVFAGVFVAWLAFCATNYYLEWGYLGSFAKGAVALTVLVGGIFEVRYGKAILRELRAYKRLKRIRDRRT